MKASSIFYLYSLSISELIVTIRYFCQGMHPGIIDACKDDLVAPSDDPRDILSLLGTRDCNP